MKQNPGSGALPGHSDKGGNDMKLQWFAGSLTVTVLKDANITTATASPASSLAKGDTVELTITPASGYELDDIEVISGGVTIDMEELEFDMDESNVTLFVKSKGNNIYKVVENTPVIINGERTNLVRNMKIVTGKSGAVVGVECEGTALNISADAIANLLESGAIVKM